MALQFLNTIVNAVTSDENVKAEAERLKAAGVTPQAIIGVIISAIMTFLTSGGGGAGGLASLIQLVLTLLQNISPPKTKLASETA